MKYFFSVPDVSCGHCKMRIESTLNEREGISSCEVDLEKKQAVVETALGQEEIIDLIDEAGYDAELITHPA